MFYDGSCGFCHSAVRFAALRDRDGSLFRFAPLDGITARREIPETARRDLPDSVVVLTTAGELKTRSDAVIHLLRNLGGGWSAAATSLALVPRPARDLLYRCVAALRRRLLPPVSGRCPTVPEDLRPRFEP